MLLSRRKASRVLKALETCEVHKRRHFEVREQRMKGGEVERLGNDRRSYSVLIGRLPFSK